MKIIFDGQEVDVFDDAALQSVIEARTNRIVDAAGVENALVREKALFNALTLIALKAGALSAYYAANGPDDELVPMLCELTEQLGSAVGLNMLVTQPAPPEETPAIFVPPGAASEGDDLGN